MTRFDGLRLRGPSDAARRTALILLPGLQMQPEDFVAHGMTDALHARDAAADICAPAIGSDDYLDDEFVTHLQGGVIAPLQAEGYARIIMLGLSLGALGALRYLCVHDGGIDALILLAPFLANPGTIAEVERAGGFAAWNPGPPGPQDIERPGLIWLKAQAASPARTPRLHLGFGTEDRFATGARLLAALLPAAQVTTAAGGHDWTTWTRLWHAMLASGEIC